MNASDLATAGTVLFPFLRCLAHDMAAPLTSTLGYAQLNLQAPGSPEELKEDLRQIEQSALSLRSQLGRMSRLSRYVPGDSSSAAGELLRDIENLSASLALSAGHQLEWEEQESFNEEQVEGNPWLLRVTCLAFLGSVCQKPMSRVVVTRRNAAIALCFPPVDAAEEEIAPDKWGCLEVGEHLVASQALRLEKDEMWSLLLPICT